MMGKITMNQMYLENVVTHLEILEVFDYYDAPILYSAISKTGQIYLARLISTGPHNTSWYYVEVSLDRYRSIRSGRIPIKDAFIGSENGLVINCTVDNDDNVAALVVDSHQLDEETLPDNEERLSHSDDWLPPQTLDISRSALSSKRQVMDVYLSNGAAGAVVSADRIGSFLLNIQALTDALACDQSTTTRRIPDYLKSRNRLYPVGVFSGSFGIRFYTADDSGLSFSDEEHALFRLTRLLNDSASFDSLSEAFKSLNLLTRSRFIRFLKGLSDHDLFVRLDWSNNRGTIQHSSLALTRVRANLAYLEQSVDTHSEINEVPGVLESASATKRTFEFKEDSGEFIRGKIDKTLFNNVISHEQFFRVPYPMIATLKQEVKVNPVTGEESWIYILLDFKLSDDD